MKRTLKNLIIASHPDNYREEMFTPIAIGAYYENGEKQSGCTRSQLFNYLIIK